MVTSDLLAFVNFVYATSCCHKNSLHDTKRLSVPLWQSTTTSNNTCAYAQLRIAVTDMEDALPYRRAMAIRCYNHCTYATLPTSATMLTATTLSPTSSSKVQNAYFNETPKELAAQVYKDTPSTTTSVTHSTMLTTTTFSPTRTNRWSMYCVDYTSETHSTMLTTTTLNETNLAIFNET